jgi:hypothetical protein
MKKITKVMTKVKHTSFGKVRVKRNVDNESRQDSPLLTIKSPLDKQRDGTEKECENITKLKVTKGKTGAIFKTFVKIKGKSKYGPEFVAMNNNQSNELIYSVDEKEDSHEVQTFTSAIRILAQLDNWVISFW